MRAVEHWTWIYSLNKKISKTLDLYKSMLNQIMVTKIDYKTKLTLRFEKKNKILKLCPSVRYKNFISV